MAWYHPKTLLDKAFEGGIILKGIHAGLEFVGGLLLLFVSPAAIQRFIALITQQELSEDPHDKLIHLLLHFTQNLGGSRVFFIVYLWTHAAIKLVAVVGLLRNKLWAYPFSLITLGAFALYQAYRIATGSVGLIPLTLFDILILWLIWREYGKARATLERDIVSD